MEKHNLLFPGPKYNRVDSIKHGERALKCKPNPLCDLKLNKEVPVRIDSFNRGVPAPRVFSPAVSTNPFDLDSVGSFDGSSVCSLYSSPLCPVTQ